MKKWSLLVGAVLLAGCGQYDIQNRAAVDVTVNDGTDSIIVKSDGTTSGDGFASFVFNTRPGSQAAYITSYSITRFDDQAVDPGSNIKNIKVYVPSGYSCPEQTQFGNTQSCDIVSATTKAANGLNSSDTRIAFAQSLVGAALASKGAVSASYDLVFRGVTATGQPIEISAKGVVATATFQQVDKPTTGTSN